MKHCIYILLTLLAVSILISSCAAPTSPGPSYEDIGGEEPPNQPSYENSVNPDSSNDVFIFEWNEKYQGYFVYEKDDNPNNYVVIPETYNGKNVVGIGKYAFDAYSKVETVVIPNSIKVIEFQAFNYCDYLKNVVIFENSQLETIKESAFYNCKSLVSIYIPASVKMIGARAFSTCPSLEEIKVDKNNEYYSDIEGNLYSKDGRLLIFVVPAENGGFWGEAVGPDDAHMTELFVPEGVIAIADGAFRDCEQIDRIYIPSSVKSIGSTVISSFIKEIVYGGTMEEWCSVRKESKWDEKSQDYVVICTDGTITKAE